MSAEDQLDKMCEQIENDPYMTPEEKHKVIREEEMAFGDHQAEYEAEQESLKRQYGF